MQRQDRTLFSVRSEPHPKSLSGVSGQLFEGRQKGFHSAKKTFVINIFKPLVVQNQNLPKLRNGLFSVIIPFERKSPKSFFLQYFISITIRRTGCLDFTLVLNFLDLWCPSGRGFGLVVCLATVTGTSTGAKFFFTGLGQPSGSVSGTLAWTLVEARSPKGGEEDPYLPGGYLPNILQGSSTKEGRQRGNYKR
uniref:Uncharacterized protein n=1 Tax=Cannabis sativa TaxID=3483 RepID=A0A803QE39_CANSA